MKLLKITGLSLSVMMLSSCGSGWNTKQKEAVKNQMGDGFSTGLANNGTTVDESVKSEWLDCVVEKAEKKWPKWDDFVKNQTDPLMETYREECAEETSLYDAIKPIQ